MENIEDKINEMVQKWIDTGWLKVTIPEAYVVGVNIKRLIENSSSKRQVDAGVMPTAYLHILDNTEGLPENIPMHILSFSKKNPYGKPGIDYDDEFEYKCQPLFLPA